MKKLKNIFILSLSIACFQTGFAMEPVRSDKDKKKDSKNSFVTLREDCAVATESTDMEINNVRARLWVGGDIWWDKTNGRYVVPKPPVGSGIDEVSSIFAGGIWLGGVDPSGNLKLAASTYPNGEADYFPGPLNSESGLTEAVTCQEWDNFFDVKGTDIKKAIRGFDAPGEYLIDSVPDGVKYWPGQGNVYFEEEYDFRLPNQEGGLGAFWDEDDNGIYNPEGGDFPIIEIRGCLPETRKEAIELVPDEMIFWIYNDAGNVHRETFGDAINMEIQVQAFAYATNDEINDMTFMRYKLINRAKEDIRETYFAMWVDPDLGCAFDDYIGCDVERSLAYTYNVDALDGQGNGVECGGTPTYQDEVPIIGTDYFRGPIAPKVICRDAEGNPAPTPGCDEHVIKGSDVFNTFEFEIGDSIWFRDPDLSIGEVGDFGFELGMSSFIYSNNCGAAAGGTPPPATCDPNNAPEYYSYLQGLWLDGVTPLTTGGDGFNPGSTDVTKFAFSGDPNDPNGWSMCQEQLAAGDRRTIQASGPFLLTPNVVNELIVGAVWVPDLDYPCPDITKLTTADDIAQNLFDNCFDIIDGPDAPTINAVELDRELIMVLHNDTLESNNARYNYAEVDIKSNTDIPDSLRIYRFEGYKVFQLAGPNVSPQELDDIDKARQIIQVDVKNGVSEIYNWTSSKDPNAIVTGNPDFVWTPERKVSGEDKGIRNTFRVVSDAFAAGDPRLINHKKYYYMAVAYAFNEYEKFNPNEFLTTQANPYLEGRGNVRTYELVPRPIVYENLNSMYGNGVKITRISGKGTGGRILDMEEGMHEMILDGSFAESPNNSKIFYKEGFGPLDIQVYNPLEVKNGRFRLEILGDHGGNCEILEGARWRLTDLDSDRVFESETTIDIINEAIIAEYGISLNVSQQPDAGSVEEEGNGALAAIIEYETEETEPWYSALRHGVPEIPADELNAVARQVLEFILTDEPSPDSKAHATDPDGEFRNLGDGFWYPFMLCSSNRRTFQNQPVPYVTPAWNATQSDPQGLLRPNGNIIQHLNNVDIVMTSDKDKWSRCIVIETASNNHVNGQGVSVRNMFTIKESPSVDKNGRADNIGSFTDSNSSNYVVNHNDDLEPEVGSEGFSWFPGYAIDVETGRRLNIYFGENSTFDEFYSKARTNNCCDNEDLSWIEAMKLELQQVCPPFDPNVLRVNPKIEQSFLDGSCVYTVFDNPGDGTSFAFYNCKGEVLDIPRSQIGMRTNTTLIWDCQTNVNQDQDGLRYTRGTDMLYNPSDEVTAGTDFGQELIELFSSLYMGGQHFIYVTREEYDGCTQIANLYHEAPIPALAQSEIFKSITWTSMGFMAEGQEILSYEDGIVPSDVTFKLRVNKAYNKETLYDYDKPNSGCILPEGNLADMPVYEFEILGKQAEDLVQEEYEGALENINVVPNPYYAYSPYERSQFDRTVKITNVPDRAIITIYTLDGKFVKQFNRAETVSRVSGSNPGVKDSQTNPSVEWDLENAAGIPIASGVYLIHISAPELGEERTIKWFGINRKFDPSGL